MMSIPERQLRYRYRAPTVGDLAHQADTEFPRPHQQNRHNGHRANRAFRQANYRYTVAVPVYQLILTSAPGHPR